MKNGCFRKTIQPGKMLPEAVKGERPLYVRQFGQMKFDCVPEETFAAASTIMHMPTGKIMEF
jgi:hypothetical protein